MQFEIPERYRIRTCHLQLRRLTLYPNELISQTMVKTHGFNTLNHQKISVKYTSLLIAHLQRARSKLYHSVLWLNTLLRQ